jgi:histidine triad (HIT) family protein
MSLEGVYDPENVFARVVRGELPAHKIYEDDKVLAFMDLFPQSRGHCLVISKISRARNILELEPEVMGHLLASVQKVAAGVVRALSPDGFIVTQFNGAPAGQTVFHLHFHIIPRYEGAALKPHAAGKMADGAELAELAASIRSAL